ncbi:MAG TPA: UPF0158 family protein [Gemmataceae bacterium]|jgi:hypothetical protein
MSCTVSLREFVFEMESFSDEHIVYLNRLTGEFLGTTEEERAAVEDEEDDDLPESERELLPKIREALSSDDWLELPSGFEIDEYAIMRGFCGTLENQTLRDDLLDTIGGRGTFGRFKNMVRRHNIHENWYRFRDEALKRIAIDWLEAHEIPYRE